MQPRCADGFQLIVTQESSCQENCLKPKDEEEASELADDQVIQFETGKSTLHLIFFLIFVYMI